MQENKKNKNTREVALVVLNETNIKSTFANISLKKHLRLNTYENLDKNFITRLVYGTLEKQITIDWVLGKVTNVSKISPVVLNILRMGCYQLLYLDKVPDSAACNESVKLCKIFGYPGLSGYVNAVLRNVSRRKNEFTNLTSSANDPKSLALKYSYPEWIIKKWIEDFGFDYTEKIVSPFTHGDYTSIRVNTLKTNTSLLRNIFEKNDVNVSSAFYLKDALRIFNIGDIEQQKLFREGCFTVQDEASMLVVDILNPKPGELVLDACAAPGGKSTYIAEKMKNVGRIIACDKYDSRVNLIVKNAERMGATILEPRVQDSCEPIGEFVNCFDKVLADVPCSGLGVSHKKPDVKLKIKSEDIDSIIKIQWEILSNCSNYVKIGGVMVYSTCTINADENQRLIYKFLNHNKNFEIDSFKEFLPEELKGVSSEDGTIQLVPSRDFIDGFFIAKLKRMY